jgi:hypothetical protein
MEQSEVRDVIALLNRQFDSHQFIQQFRSVFPASYESMLARRNNVQYTNSAIGRYLSRNSYSLNIRKIGRVSSCNINGYKSQCANWVKL